MSAAAIPVPSNGDHNQGPTIEAIIWTFSSIALVTVVLRIFGRLRLTRNAGWDDFWIVVSMILNIIYAALVEVSVKAGCGRHPYYIGPQKTSDATRWSSIALVPGVISFTAPKLSVAILLARLLNPNRVQKYFMYSLSVLLIIGSCVSAILLWQQCKPSSAMWNPTPEAKCWSPNVLTTYSIVHGALSAFADFYLAGYACFVIYNLQMSARRKAGISISLSLGFVAGVIASYKCTQINDIKNRDDHTYSITGLLIWTSIEGSFIIIAADLPTLRPSFRSVMNEYYTLRSSFTHSSKYHSYKLHDLPTHADGDVEANGKRGDGGARDPFPVPSSRAGAYDSKERILEPGKIRKTWEVDVSHEARQDKLERPRELERVHEGV